MKSLLVTGDWVIDHHLYEGRRKHFADRSPGVAVREAPGGAALIQQLLRRRPTGDGAGNGELLPSEWESHQAVEVPAQPPGDQVAYAFWRSRPGPKDTSFWRVGEGMGFGPVSCNSPCSAWPPADNLPEQPGVIVLSDGGMGFRQSEGCWRKLPFATATWIVYKTESPDLDGALWQTLSKHRQQLVVVIPARELRRGDARISSGLSWEATLQDLYRELTSGALRELTAGCAHLVVAFDTEAALWLDLSAKRSAAPEAHFIFDAPVMEGERRREVDPEATAFGLTSCLTAGVVWSLTEAVDNSTPADLWDGIEGGLSAMRDLLERGHGPAGRDASPPAGFPARRLADVIKSPRHLFSRSAFPWDHTVSSPEWSLLRQASPDMTARARLLAIHGDIALCNVPHLRIGNLFTADRPEIESLRTLIQIIHRYREPAEKGRKPLSVGVFGPPGSGKSFAVEEIARQLFDKDAWLVFNLSQFKDPTDLVGAFHQVRDKALKGIIPVAFFDEFDSQNLRWLQYLLAPMQDGSFQEGQITHPIGKCVCVFAGGSFTYESFTPAPGGKAEETEAERHFRAAKGPDFSSRLDAVLEVSGPNRRFTRLAPGVAFDPQQHVRGGTHCFARDTGDDYFGISRARAIRFKLGIKADECLDIEPSLLDALLRVPEYTHSSRSLEKILDALKICRPERVCPSALPPRGQLGMHTDATTFHRLLESPPAKGRASAGPRLDVETVAEQIHEAYRELGRRRGWLEPGSDKDKDFGKMLNLQGVDDPEFTPEQVSGWLKESNREAARRMPGLLELAGLTLELATGAGTAPITQMRLESLLELVARQEHDGWMQWHFKHGWRWAKARNDLKKLHHLLIPYAELEDAERTKDRSQVRQFPLFAAMAGLRVVPG